jgi:hypothetical protein
MGRRLRRRPIPSLARSALIQGMAYISIALLYLS